MLVITLVSGKEIEVTDCTRWMTDESNNLCVYVGDVLCAIYNAECWLSALLRDEED